ncbi:MAG: hypothetical protein JRJ79_05195 [Deltaproteobacteria bacterium]|nr:hypothetical protein [Deltaproteobacteria bacterium]MBW1795908.1 hypothetical protein [Deltaproteobacteria bacterium]
MIAVPGNLPAIARGCVRFRADDKQALAGGPARHCHVSGIVAARRAWRWQADGGQVIEAEFEVSLFCSWRGC